MRCPKRCVPYTFYSAYTISRSIIIIIIRGVTQHPIPDPALAIRDPPVSDPNNDDSHIFNLATLLRSRVLRPFLVFERVIRHVPSLAPFLLFAARLQDPR